MRLLTALTLCLLLLAGIAAAADVTGKWVAEQKITTPNGDERTVTTTFDLKSSGDAITGTITGGMGRRGGGDGPPPANEIKEGKLDGNKFSLKVVAQGRNGEVTMLYQGTVEGTVLKGTVVREGGQGEPRPFEAKKQ